MKASTTSVIQNNNSFENEEVDQSLLKEDVDRTKKKNKKQKQLLFHVS